MSASGADKEGPSRVKTAQTKTQIPTLLVQQPPLSTMGSTTSKEGQGNDPKHQISPAAQRLEDDEPDEW
jgi:hypothetical protein